jgi:gas vesicle protein
MSRKSKVQNWARTAVKLGLLLTDPKVRNTIGETFKEHASDVSDTLSDTYSDVSGRVSSKYEDVMDRLDSLTDGFQNRNPWPSRVGGFLLGVGVGVGVGMLFAPAAGSETREATREAVSGMKDRVVESANNMTGKIRNTVTSMPSTGTEG